jgi:PadR family transcriptional regulator PadR
MQMSIAGDLIRGHTDAIILARLLQGDSYGYEINKMICTLSSGRFELKEATLYTAFKRLEEQGYVTAYWGDRGAAALLYRHPGGAGSQQKTDSRMGRNKGYYG